MNAVVAFHFGRFLTGTLTFLLVLAVAAGFVLGAMPELLDSASGSTSP